MPIFTRFESLRFLSAGKDKIYRQNLQKLAASVKLVKKLLIKHIHMHQPVLLSDYIILLLQMEDHSSVLFESWVYCSYFVKIAPCKNTFSFFQKKVQNDYHSHKVCYIVENTIPYLIKYF